MRLMTLVLILIATFVGSAFWYDAVHATCRVPVRYHIGAVDQRFGTSVGELSRITQNAELLWEDALQQDLFVRDESEESLPINLVFDERQEEAELEAELRADLEAKEGMSESVSREYEKLITEFRKLKREYEARVVAYEASLAQYNSEVTDWNDRGGAPVDVVDELREREEVLTGEQSALEALAQKLNTIVADLNRIGARGNELITDYNTIVEEYNTSFSEVREFAQGDYTGDAINVYQFDSEEELTIVLAHELGHALSLGHASGEASIMYHHMGAQTTEAGVTAGDIEEYTRACSQRSFFERAVAFIGAIS